MANKNASPKVYAMERMAELQKSVALCAGLTLFTLVMTAVYPLVVGSHWDTNSTTVALVLMGATVVISIVFSRIVMELAKLREESHIPSLLYWLWLSGCLALVIPVVCMVGA